MRKEVNIMNAVEKLLENIKKDYYEWTVACAKGDLSEINKRMIAEFNEELGYKEGNKYIKITTKNGGSVWGFVVNTETDKKFQKGDILKPAGWAAPARNGARGNIFEDYTIRWTGPLYLR